MEPLHDGAGSPPLFTTPSLVGAQHTTPEPAAVVALEAPNPLPTGPSPKVKVQIWARTTRSRARGLIRWSVPSTARWYFLIRPQQHIESWQRGSMYIITVAYRKKQASECLEQQGADEQLRAEGNDV